MSEPNLTTVGHDEAGAGGVTGATDQPGGGRQNSLWSDAWRQLRRNAFFWIGALFGLLFVAMALLPSVFARGVDPRSCSLSNSNGTPSAEHWFGFDQQGCDYLANVVYGARNSLIIGLLAVVVILVFGVLVGAISGFYGGVTDSILSRIADIFYALPLILGALVVLRSGILGRGVVAVAIALAMFGWMTAMRLVRSQVIAVKSSDYVAAARAMGASDSRILLRHILPNAVAPVLVYATITIGVLIAAEATLTFLGVGLQAPAISWGLQIDTGQDLLRTAPHAVLFPSLVLTLTVMAFVLMGDALRDALDPKQRS
ncbi:ABC transporter permease [Blastococcus sp. VKM Ac-2987]|uniref:ABC transporter permease n=1 Tax=Blastococcus sp. VKM Ac-2987 TaxID=3004141 RepID=UPI0022AB51D6|nr:ABC transporter permease [Blastococcus sp. VKM Ac-2987]MCZ2857944.1 ABC transporter permease [Blastococcus sp. VKM Ac-2987]